MTTDVETPKIPSEVMAALQQAAEDAANDLRDLEKMSQPRPW